MSTDLYKQVLYNDGEGLTHGDLNDSQRMALSRLWDQLIHNQFGNFDTATTTRDPQFGGQDGIDHPTSRAYCLNPGAAYLRQGSTNAKIQIAPGTLLQKLAILTGDDPQILAYTFVGTEEWTLTNGDATNPRVDLLQMKLEWVTGDVQLRDFKDATTGVLTSTSMNKKRRVQCTLSVKVGTASASPITVPEPDAGYVPVGFCVVGNGWTTGGNAPIFGEDTAATNNLVVYDVRMPISVKAYTVSPQMTMPITNWAVGSGNTVVSVSNATNELQAVCPHYNNGRLLGIAVCRTDGTTGLSGQTLARKSVGPSGIAVASRSTLAALSGAADKSTDIVLWHTFEASHSPSAGPTITPSATTKIGAPIWTNGRRCPHEVFRLVTANARQHDRLIYRVVNTGTNLGNPQIFEIVFFVAEGL